MSSPKNIPVLEDKKTVTMSKSVPINISSKSESIDNDLALSKSPPKILQTSLYKTERCRSWITTGMCKYGNKCQFAHGDDELRPVLRHPKYKTQICKTFSREGFCPYSSRCRFIHPGEIDSKSPPSDFDYEPNSLQNTSPLLGRSNSPISSSLLNIPLFNNTNSNSNEKNLNEQNIQRGKTQAPQLFSNSLPNFMESNWLHEKKEKKVPFWTNNLVNSPKQQEININNNNNNNDNEELDDPFDFYGTSPLKNEYLLSPKTSFFHNSSPSPVSHLSPSPISQFAMSPSPLSQNFFKFGITPPNVMNGSNIEDKEETNEKKIRSNSIDIFGSPSQKDFQIPIIKSKPTAIPNSSQIAKNNHNHYNSNNNTASPNDSKSRLPIFESLAN